MNVYRIFARIRCSKLLTCLFLLSAYLAACADAPSLTQKTPELFPAYIVKAGKPGFGYINAKGQWLIAPTYSAAGWFSDGLARVEANGGVVEYIDASGTVRLKPEYKLASDFHDGLAAFGIATRGDVGKMGFMDSSGGVAIPPRYDLELIRDEGEAPQEQFLGYELNPRFGTWPWWIRDTFVHYVFGKPSRNEDKYVLFDKSGRALWSSTHVIHDGGESLYLVEMHIPVPYWEWREFRNMKGQLAIPKRFEDAMPFSEGVAAFKKGGLWGFIDRSGNVLVSPKYEVAGSFSDGFAMAVSRAGLSYSLQYLDHGFRAVYREVLSYPDRPTREQFKPWKDLEVSEGVCPYWKWSKTEDAAAMSEPLYGFRTPQGKVVISPRFSAISPFYNGLAYVYEADGTPAYINHEGLVVWRGLRRFVVNRGS